MTFISFLAKQHKLYNYLSFPRSSYRFYDKTKIVIPKNEIQVKIILQGRKPQYFKIRSRTDGLTKHKITKMLHKIIKNQLNYDEPLIIYGIINDSKSKNWTVLLKQF